MIEAYQVSKLARILKELIEGDLRLTNIWVEGEISNLSRSSGGHLYFTLKDEAAQVRCVMFRRAYGGAPLENGQQVLGHGYVSFYETRGEVQFYVDFVQPAGIGVRRAQFERLKAQLEAEGLFEPSRKRPLPPFPQRVGVVTSPVGAVFQDICQVIARRWPLTEVVLAPTPVQGVEAPAGIVAALRHLNEEEGIALIIVARGGGPLEEMWPFNEELVARAIYGSQAPVISAVGHETDYTIADYVADVRAPTPSAAAELAVPDWRDIARRLESLGLTLQTWTRGLLNQQRGALRQQNSLLRRSLPNLKANGEGVGALVRAMGTLLTQPLAQRREQIGAFARQLSTLDPEGTLARGYAIVQQRDKGQTVTSVSQIKGRDRLDVFVKDGKFPAEVSRQYGF